MQLLMEQEMATEDPLKTLSSDYLNLFTDGQSFSDVTFCVEGRRVHAHRCILAARSTFFRTLFCNGDALNELGAPHGGSTCVIPVGIVGYDVFLIVLQFLYSGQLMLATQHSRTKCHERACWHTYCSSAVELALDALRAANFFGVQQLSILIQKQLATLVDKASIDDVMRVLMAAKKQEFHHLWMTCSELVAKSGLTREALRKHLPLDVVREIEEMRTQRGYGRQMSNGRDNGSLEEQRIRRMQQALDSLDVELVRLMVMGEGLNLDKAHALHYGVANCSREVVKALLELGAVDVNHPISGGRTALHLASEMANPEMIAVLLDHHAAPHVRTADGATPLDIVQSLAVESTSSPTGKTGLQNKPDHNKLRLCLELLQSAAFVATKEEESCEDEMTEVSDNSRSCLVAITSRHDSSTSPLIETEQSDVQELNLRLPTVGTYSLESDNYMFNSNFTKSSALANGSLDGLLFSVYNSDLRVPMLGVSETAPASAIF